MVSRKQQIKAAIARIELFRRWFRRIPSPRVRLNLWFRSPFFFSRRRLQCDQIECGSVGCLGGWLEHSPVYAQWKHKVRGIDEFVGDNLIVDGVAMFACRRCPTISQKKEALNRLRDRLRSLRKELRR